MSKEELINAIEEEIKKTNAYLNVNEENYRMGYRKAIYDTTYLFEKLKEENDKLHSIIKKVREYIKDACYLDEINYPNSLGHKQTMKILEILDSENKGE